MARLDLLDSVSQCTGAILSLQPYPSFCEYVRLPEERNVGRVMVWKAIYKVHFHGPYYSNVMKFSSCSEEMALPPFQERYCTSDKKNFLSDIV
jgi:hypothetical protein